MRFRCGFVRFGIAVMLVVAALFLTHGPRVSDATAKSSVWAQRPLVSLSARARSWARAFGQLLNRPGRLVELEAELAVLHVKNAELEKLLADTRKLITIERERADFLKSADITVVARVIAGVFESSAQEITIDRGRSSGIREHDPVLAHGALIGTASTVTETRTVVRLLMDPDTRLGVALVTQPETLGILGADSGGGIVVTYIPSDREVAKAATIVTGLINEGVPPGIPIGKIADIRPDADGFFRTAVIDPIVDPREETFVTVLQYSRER